MSVHPRASVDIRCPGMRPPIWTCAPPGWRWRERQPIVGVYLPCHLAGTSAAVMTTNRHAELATSRHRQSVTRDDIPRSISLPSCSL